MIMKILYSLLVILFIIQSAFAEPMVARVTIDTDDDVKILRTLGASILHGELTGIVDIVIDDAEIPYFRSIGFELSDIVPLSATGLTDIDPEYHTFEEFTHELRALERNYPNLCKLDSIGRGQQFPRTVWCMKVSDNPTVEEDEIAVLYIGIHHACEVVGGETCLTYGHIGDMVYHMKTTLNISDVVMARLKREAASQGRTMSELVETALRMLLEARDAPPELPPLPELRSGGARVNVANRDALYEVMER